MSRCFLCCFDRNNKPICKPDGEVDAPATEPAGALDAKLGMSANDRKLIKDTCDEVFKQRKLQDKSVDFLIEFFKRYPHHQRYFKMFRDVPPEELTTIPLLENHGRRVMDQIVKLVQNMEDLDLVQEQLAWISMKHKPRKVRSRQFKDMLAMFVEYVGQEMGDLFTDQHDQAWQKWLDYILSELEKEETKANALNGKTSTATVADASSHESGTRPGTIESERLLRERGTESVKAEPDLLPLDKMKVEAADGKTNDGIDNEVTPNKAVDESKDNVNTNARVDSNRYTAEDFQCPSNSVSDSVNKLAIENAEGLKHNKDIIYSKANSQELRASKVKGENQNLVESSNVLASDNNTNNVYEINFTPVTNSNDQNNTTITTNNPALPSHSEDLKNKTHPNSVQGVYDDTFPNESLTQETNMKSQTEKMFNDQSSLFTDNANESLPTCDTSRYATTVSDSIQSTTNVDVHFSEPDPDASDPKVPILDTNENSTIKSPSGKEINPVARA